MARSNSYLLNDILPGGTESQIVRILDKADNWNSLFLETLNDSWRMSKDKRKKASRKINRGLQMRLSEIFSNGSLSLLVKRIRRNCRSYTGMLKKNTFEFVVMF